MFIYNKIKGIYKYKQMLKKIIGFLMIINTFFTASINTNKEIQIFKGKGYEIRKKKLIACWLLLSDGLSQQVSKMDKQIIDNKIHKFEKKHLSIIKECLYKISNQQSVLKISSLIQNQHQKQVRMSQIVQNWQSIIDNSQNLEQLNEVDQHIYDIVSKYSNQLFQAQLKGNLKTQLQIRQKQKQQSLSKLKSSFGQGFMWTLVVASLGVMIFLLCTCYQFRKMQQNRQLKHNNKKKRVLMVEEKREVIKRLKKR